jgi:glycerate kinase
VKILIAPDKFKDALDACAVAEALATGARQACPSAEIVVCPMADGGEGTGRLLAEVAHAQQRTTRVRNPLGPERDARWWWDEQQAAAIIEMAEASGLNLLTEAERDATRTTSYGTGQLMQAAIDTGARHVTLCVGGSATVDGGAGCLQALGWELIDPTGECIRELAAGGTLERIGEIRPPEPMPRLSIEVLCDVNNPLLGARGAAAVFGPQKGAPPPQVRQLEAGMENWAAVLAACTGREVTDLPGAGAAGGLPAALAAALTAKLLPGFDEVARRLGLRAKLAGCDLCLTGEGRLDEQTVGGKVVAGVAELGRQVGVPVVALAGEVRPPPGHTIAELARSVGLHEIVVVTPPNTPTDTALAAAADNLRTAVRRFLRPTE